MSDEEDVIPELAGYPPSLTTRQAAEVLGVEPDWLAVQLRKKHWPAFRVGWEWRMRRSVVQQIMQGADLWQRQGEEDDEPPQRQ